MIEYAISAYVLAWVVLELIPAHSFVEGMFIQRHLVRSWDKLVVLSESELPQLDLYGCQWWGQSGGKGKRTSAVLRADFKAALAKTTADAAAASEGEL